jgi:hypothetical protein
MGYQVVSLHNTVMRMPAKKNRISKGLQNYIHLDEGRRRRTMSKRWQWREVKGKKGGGQ